jgi:putative effector of murein hydrolase
MSVWQQPVFMIGLTFGCFVLAMNLFERYRKPWLNPSLTALLLICGILTLFRAPVQDYLNATKALFFLLSPAVVSLALILYEQREALQSRALAIVSAVLAGGLVNVLCSLLLARWFGLPDPFPQALAAKSVTTAIAVALMEPLQGDTALTIAFVLLSGLMGSVFGIPFFKLLGWKNDLLKGLATGSVSHGIGTARLQQENDLMAAASALAMALNGMMTAFYLPVLYPLLMR